MFNNFFSIRAQIHHSAGEAEIRIAAQKDGMQTMREDGERWLKEGVTTREELMRVTKDWLMELIL